ncbi:unnamed protein product [Adineta steineri]|uniref:Uncharacterized protein n=1 Tax=Adineta steineri TaxID=433720 RepID=A0A819MJT8_9BILA|nr:unnamed protein product [Adineta steineri]CAF3981050.1 unnamed protein product [Adineta steineri]
MNNDFGGLRPPQGYSRISAPVEISINPRSKIWIPFIIFGSTLLLVVTIVTYLIVFKPFYQHKSITTTTTVSTRTTQVSIPFTNAQCSASNCPNGETCCLSDVLWTKMRCCRGDTPVCCASNQGWCCRIHAPVCCGKFSCCPLNQTCCTIQGIEQCCLVNNTTMSTVVI